MADERAGTLLYRTPYFVLPRLAIEAMSDDWQKRFFDLLEEAADVGLDTPEYHVFRADPPPGMRGCKQVNKGAWDQTPFYRLTGGWNGDPWADYRHGNAWEIMEAKHG